VQKIKYTAKSDEAQSMACLTKPNLGEARTSVVPLPMNYELIYSGVGGLQHGLHST